MEKKSRRVKIVKWLLKMEYFYKNEIDFLNSTVMNKIKEKIDLESETNGKLIHGLGLKKMLKNNNIDTKDD